MINSSNICPDYPLLLFNCPVILKWGKMKYPQWFFYKEILKLNWKLCFVSRFQWLMANFFHRPIFEILIHLFLPVLVCVSERIPNQQRSLRTRKYVRKRQKVKKIYMNWNERDSCPSEYDTRHIINAPLVNFHSSKFFFFSISLGSLVLALLIRHQLLKKHI